MRRWLRPCTPEERALAVDRFSGLLLSAREVAEVFNLSPTYVTRLATRGELPYLQTPLGRLFQEQDVLAFAARRAAQQAERAARQRRRLRVVGGGQA